MRVKIHWAQRFIDWFPHHTKLYIRGERNADHAKADALRKELFDALVPFLDRMRTDARAEARKELAQELARSLPHIITNTPHSCQTQEHCCALHAAHRAAANKVEERLQAIAEKG